MSRHDVECPFCHTLCTVRGEGRGTYGVHFPSPTASKPCDWSYKPLIEVDGEITVKSNVKTMRQEIGLEDAIATARTASRDLHHSQGVSVAEVLAGIDEENKKEK